MRFVVSLLAFRPGRIGGTEQAIRDLLDELPHVCGRDEVVVLAAREAADAAPAPKLGRRVVDIGAASLVARRGAEAFGRWRDRRLEREVAALKPDAVFFPQISMFPRCIEAPAALYVGDVQHLVLPHLFPFVDRAFRAAIYPYSMRKARLVMAASEATRRDLVARARVDDAKIRVVRHGAPPPRDPSTVARPPVDGRYLYFPAASNPHKGHEELLKAFAALARDDDGLRLVLSGQKTAHWPKLDALARELGIRARVQHVGWVDRATVDALYAHAEAVVFPSRFEGFGLPVVEAASFGGKVVASRLDVFDEQGTTGVQRIDFRDAAQLRAALASPQRAGLAPGAWTRRDSAAAVMAALRECAGNPSAA